LNNLKILRNPNAKLHKKINSLEKEIDRLIDEKENNIRKIDLKELKEKADIADNKSPNHWKH